MYLGVDVGYGFTKVAAGDGRRASFPSVAMPARGSGELAEALGAAHPKHLVRLARHGAEAEVWWVGRAALNAGGKRSWDTAATRRHAYEVLALTALFLAGAEGAVAAGVGLPLAIYLQKEERRALRRLLHGLSAWVSVDGADARHVALEQVRVFPQGVGAYFTARIGPGGERLAGMPVGVIDVGYRTTDCLLLEAHGEDAEPDEARSGSIDAGVGQVYDAVRDRLSAELALMVPGELVERAVSNGGVLFVRGQKMDINGHVSAAAREVAGRIEAELRRVWSQRLDFLGAVLVAGGGGAMLMKHLDLPGLQLTEEPLYANAVGFAGMMALAQAGVF